MRKILVPVIILATVALSSSNVLPVASMNGLNTDPLYDYQENDNTFNTKHQSKNKLNAILFNVQVEPEIDKTPTNYADNIENFNSMSKDDNYNFERFRQEQWHNYPRQLDRLNRYLYQHQSADKRNLDPDDPENVYADTTKDGYQEIIGDALSKEYVPENEPDTHIQNNEAEIAAAVINPLLIFRIQLACYNNNKASNQLYNLTPIDLDNDRLQYYDGEDKSVTNEVNPESNQVKVKRKENKNSEEEEDTKHEPSGNPTVNKRIFALFSRLQSLNPKGHQLHHRRHMYAMYGPPDTDGGGGGGGGGVLTAETRATFMRPPGSPLRWG